MNDSSKLISTVLLITIINLPALIIHHTKVGLWYNTILTLLYPAMSLFFGTYIYFNNELNIEKRFFTRWTIFSLIVSFGGEIIRVINAFNINMHIIASYSSHVFRLLAYIFLLILLIRRIFHDRNYISLNNNIIHSALVLFLFTLILLPDIVSFIGLYGHQLNVSDTIFITIVFVLGIILFFILVNLLLLYIKLKHSHYWLFLIIAVFLLLIRDFALIYLEQLRFYQFGSTPDFISYYYYICLIVCFYILKNPDIHLANIANIDQQRMHYKELYDEFSTLSLNLLTTNKFITHDLNNDFLVIAKALELYLENGDNHFLEMMTKRLQQVEERIAFYSSYDLVSVLTTKHFPIKIVCDLAKTYYSELDIDCNVQNSMVKASFLLPSIIHNIIDNAYKHNEDVQVRMTVKEEKEFIFIEVADTGKGFPENIKEAINKGNLLEVKKVTTRQGISLAKETLNKYDGDLIILDNEPHGAIVRVKIRKINKNS